MSRILQERWLVADKNHAIFPANKVIFYEKDDSYGINPNIKANQIVIYNADTGISVAAGVTAANTPNLAIAQGIDTNGDGYADVLRNVAFKKIPATSLNAITAEPPVCGQIKIVDVGIGCVKKGESYSLTIEARTEETERFYEYNDYERFTETVEFGYDKCKDCDDELSCKEVACALANKFNGKDRKYSLRKNLSLLRRARDHQDKDRPFEVYVLHENDYEFCFNTSSTPCVGCNRINDIGSIIVGTGDGAVTTTFNGAWETDSDDVKFTNVNRVESIIEQINTALGDKGHAVNASGFIGSAKPCCDGVKILINSCVPITLLDGDNVTITPCDTGLPTDNVVTQGSCGSCGPNTTQTPCAYLRIVPKPMKLDKYYDRPDSWLKTLYTDIRVSTSYNHNNFGFFREFVRQDYKIPRGLVYEVQHHILKQDTSMNEPFSWGYDEFSGPYKNFIEGSRTPTMGTGIFAGCDSYDSVCIYNIEHDGPSKDTSVAANPSDIHFRTKIVVPSSNTGLKTEIEAILNPWIASIPGKSFVALDCSAEPHGDERVINNSFGVTQDRYPNGNGKIIAG